MIITFLGTGTSQGVPIIACSCDTCLSEDKRDKRLRSSLMFTIENRNFVIDSGPDFRFQMLRENVKTLDAIILTHEHRDHIAGLDDIRAFNYFQRKPVDVYAEKKVINAVKSDFFYAFADEKYPGIPEMNLHEIDEYIFFIDNIKIIPIRALHLKLPVLGYRINNFAYLTDLNYISELELEKLQNLDIFVISALRIKKHISHFNLEESLQIIEKIKPRRAFLTHISHQLGKHDDICRLLPNNVFPAFDGLKIDV